jgi:hypothetical protein
MSVHLRRSLSMSLVALLAGLAMALWSAPASAKVIHHVERSFKGEGTTTLGPDLLAAAVDNSGGASEGDVYVLESKNEKGEGGDAVDKFTGTGTSTGLRITGAETTFKSFDFGLFFAGVAVDSSL